MAFGCKLTTWTLAFLTKPSSIDRFRMMLAMQPTLSERLEGGTPGSCMLARMSVSAPTGRWKLVSSSYLINGRTL
jgi:hypothetical protein